MVLKRAFAWVTLAPSQEAHPTEATTAQVAAQLDVLLEMRKPNLTLAVVAALAGERGEGVGRCMACHTLRSVDSPMCTALERRLVSRVMLLFALTYLQRCIKTSCECDEIPV